VIFKLEPQAELESPADVAIDELTPEDVERLKYEIWSDERVMAFESVAMPRGIVAEGDSWFDYAPGIDILDHLTKLGHAIAKVAEGGDSLENMVFGSKYDRRFARRTNPLNETIRLMKDEGAKVLLFSGGGNDIAGDELEAYLNHKDLNLGTFRTPYVDYVFGTAIRATYEHLIRRVRTEVAADAQIVSHGYGWAIPDGRAVINLPWGYRFVGPWLRPALTKKNYVEANERREIIRTLVNRFNDTLASIADEPQFRDNFHYIDLRAIIQDDWWVNELHLKNSAYGRVAAEFDRIIRAL